MKRELGLRFPANNPVCALRWPGTALPRGRMRKGGDGVLSEADAAQPERAVPLFVLSFRQRDELAASASGAGWRVVAARRADDAERRFLASGAPIALGRAEERRVGNECVSSGRSRRSPCQ